MINCNPICLKIFFNEPSLEKYGAFSIHLFAKIFSLGLQHYAFLNSIPFLFLPDHLLLI